MHIHTHTAYSIHAHTHTRARHMHRNKLARKRIHTIHTDYQRRSRSLIVCAYKWILHACGAAATMRLLLPLCLSAGMIISLFVYFLPFAVTSSCVPAVSMLLCLDDTQAVFLCFLCSHKQVRHDSYQTRLHTRPRACKYANTTIQTHDMQTRKHNQWSTYTLTRKHIHIRMHMPRTETYILPYNYVLVQERNEKRTRGYKWTYVYTHTHIHTYTHITHTNTHTHTNT